MKIQDDEKPESKDSENEKKFDSSGNDKDLVEGLERDILQRNPNVRWYIFINFCSILLNFNFIYNLPIPMISR